MANMEKQLPKTIQFLGKTLKHYPDLNCYEFISKKEKLRILIEVVGGNNEEEEIFCNDKTLKVLERKTRKALENKKKKLISLYNRLNQATKKY